MPFGAVSVSYLAIPCPFVSPLKNFTRTLLAILVAVWVAVPTVGGEGGENAGGTGVWILPASSFVGMPCWGPSGPSRQLTDFTKDLRMVVDPNCGQVLATVTDPLTAVVIPLTVCGRDVTLAASTLRAYSDAQVSSVVVLIVDSQQRGYYMTVTINTTAHSASVQIHQ